MNVVEVVIIGKNLAGPAMKSVKADATMLSSTWGKTGLVAGAALIAIGVEASRMSNRFQAEMTRLNTQAGVSKDQLKGLERGVLNLAGKIGASPDSLAESLYHVESNFRTTGISSKTALAMVEVAAKGAKVGGANLVDVTNALTAAVAAQIPGVSNLDQAMGALNATVGSGDMKMQDLANAFGTGAVAVVKGYGLSITDVGAALAVFGDNNIRGARAGTNLRMAVQSLAVPTKAGARALASLGLTSVSLAKDMESGGLMKALTDLHQRLLANGIGAKQQGQIITDMFGKKAGTGINILMGQFDRLKGKYPEITRGANQFGDAWATTGKTSKQQLDMIKGAFDAMMITIGDKVLPVVMKLVAFIATHRPVFEALAILLGVVLVAALISVAIAMIAATWEIIVIVAAIVALIAIGYILYKNWGTIWKFCLRIINDVWDWIKGHWPLLLGILMGPVGIAIGFIIMHFHSIVAVVSGVMDAIGRAFSSAYHFIADPIIAAVNAVIGAIERMVGIVSGAVGKAKGFINSIPVVGGFLKHFGLATGGIVASANGSGHGGLTLVGEHGPELVDLPGGSKVHSNSDSEGMMGRSGRGGRVVIELNSSGSHVDDLLVEILRRSIRVRGGNVQVVLGRG